MVQPGLESSEEWNDLLLPLFQPPLVSRILDLKLGYSTPRPSSERSAIARALVLVLSTSSAACSHVSKEVERDSSKRSPVVALPVRLAWRSFRRVTQLSVGPPIHPGEWLDGNRVAREGA